MIPIYEQGKSKGIGHSYETFTKRFLEICNQKKSKGEASRFAFILYDFKSSAIKKILKSQGGFARLDRLSGKYLSIFYLHSNKPETVKHFNKVFHKAFGVREDIDYPFVLVFDVVNDEVENIEIVSLEQDNLLFAFEELYSIIKNYKNRIVSSKQSKPTTSKFSKVFDLTPKDYKKIAVTEFVKLIFKGAYEQIYNSLFR